MALAGFGMVLSIVFGALLFCLGILWLITPFAIFGIKPRLDALIAEMRQLNAMRRQIQYMAAAMREMLELARPYPPSAPNQSAADEATTSLPSFDRIER